MPTPAPTTTGLPDYDSPEAVADRRKRYARLIVLIEEWLADESGYDEAVWPQIKKGIEEARPSYRKRFSD